MIGRKRQAFNICWLQVLGHYLTGDQIVNRYREVQHAAAAQYGNKKPFVFVCQPGAIQAWAPDDQVKFMKTLRRNVKDWVDR